MWTLRKFVLCRPDDGASGGGGGAAAGGDVGGAAAGAAAGAGASGGAPDGGAPAAAAAGEGGAPAGGSAGAAGGAAAGSGAAGAGDAGAAGDAGKANENYWPADWRDTVSKGDAKILQRMGRYASPQAAMEALIAAQNRISAGELKPVLGKNATPEQLKEYREALGIPETPDKYDLGKDIKIDGIDPALLGEVLKEAHESNQTPEQVKATLKAWTKISQSVQEQRYERDVNIQKTSEDALRAEWGPEYRRNINLIHGMLDSTATPGLKESVMGGRLADGTPIGSSPEALKFLVGLALIQNPAGVVVPGSEANPMQGVEDEITKIETGMRKDRAAYNKDEKLQARYLELLTAREKLKPRKAS